MESVIIDDRQLSGESNHLNGRPRFRNLSHQHRQKQQLRNTEKVQWGSMKTYLRGHDDPNLGPSVFHLGSASRSRRFALSQSISRVSESSHGTDKT